MARLALTLCGQVTATVHGRPMAGAPLGAKALALLAYLALEPGPHSREALMALLWGDFPEDKARASLRQALAHLRHALGDALEVSRGSVALAERPVCDVDVLLREARDPAERRAAMNVDVARFLADLQLRRCAAFDEWVDATRRLLRRAYASALAELASDALARLDWRDAAAVADRWLAADPLSDDAARVAVEARHLAGDRAGALVLYDEHRARVQADCGRAPSRPLRALAERVALDSAALDGAGASGARPNGATAASAPSPAAPSFRVPLVGRDEEWASLQRAWRETAAGGGRVVVVAGRIGIGKSRLADDFGRWAATHGGAVLRGRAHEAGAAVPFGLVGDVLRSAADLPGVAGADGQWLAELSRLVPELRRRLPGIPALPAAAPADAWRIYEASAQLLLALAAEQPVLVALDDVQWCDADSASLAGFLVHRLAGAPVLWCATVTLGAAERSAPGMRLVRTLRSTHHAELLRPRPLDEGETRATLRELGALADGAALHRLVRHVHGEAAGTPLYVVELLRAMFARGLLVARGDGAWELAPAYAEGLLPDVRLADLPAVRAPIDEQIARLPDDARDVLVTIAVGRGARCDAFMLSHVHGVSRLRAAALAETLLERALVVERDGAYQCAHPVIAAVVSDGVGASWRREVERAVATVLVHDGPKRRSMPLPALAADAPAGWPSDGRTGGERLTPTS